MADAHDKLCEEADVGSLCDCSCAGSKHAIRHTKGGVPGAGAVSKAAQAAAHAAGKAAVINNRAEPKEGSTVSASAPKSFKEAAKAEPGAKPAKPITMMSNLSGHTDEELKAAHAAIEAKIKPQGGISGPQRDVQQKIERELALRGRPLGKTSPHLETGKQISREDAAKVMFGTRGGQAKIDAANLKGKGNSLDERAAARTAAKFGDAAEVTRGNTAEGDRVTHVREGVGTVEQVPRFGAWRVKFDNGGSKPVLPHEMVKGEHGGGAGTNVGHDGKAEAKTPDKAMTVTSRRRNGDVTTEAVAKPAGPAPSKAEEYVPPHVKEAIDHLEGRKGGVSSYVYGALNHNSLSKLTPEQRTKMRGQLENIQSGMDAHATDKPRVDKALASLRAIDAPTGRPKKAKALPERQAKALDAVAKAGSSDRNANSLIDINKYAGENHVVASALAKKGLLRQGGTNARLVQLTEAGHEQVALARGDQKHLTLTQHVAALAAQADDLEKRSKDMSVSQSDRFTADQQARNIVARMRELQDQRRRYLNGDSSQGVETRR